jgi:hypothetical protein
MSGMTLVTRRIGTTTSHLCSSMFWWKNRCRTQYCPAAKTVSSGGLVAKNSCVSGSRTLSTDPYPSAKAIPSSR